MEQNGRPELSKNREAKDLPDKRADKRALVCRPDAPDRVLKGFQASQEAT